MMPPTHEAVVEMSRAAAALAQLLVPEAQALVADAVEVADALADVAEPYRLWLDDPATIPDAVSRAAFPTYDPRRSAQ